MPNPIMPNPVSEEIKDRAAAKVAGSVAGNVPQFGAGTTKNTTPETPSSSALQGQSSRPIPNTDPNAFEAGMLGGSGATPAAVGSTLETTGHVKPSTTDTPPAGIPPNQPGPVPMPIKSIPAVAADGPPTTKQMLSKVVSGPGKPYAEESAGAPFNFADLLKGAVNGFKGSGLENFLQHLGMSLQGSPTGMTQQDIQRAQAFELQKTQMEAEIGNRRMALDNQYQTQRMNLQNQMNLANIPIEMKARIQEQISALDAQYQNEVKLMPMRIQQERAMRGMQPGNYSMNSWTGGK